jgi:Mg2+/citrate symporter
MTMLSGNEMLIAAGISIFSIIISVFLIRMVANILLLLAFSAAVVAPIVWHSHEKASGSEMSVLGLYLAAVIFAFIITLMTTPLWPISSLMQWTGKRERNRIEKIEKSSSNQVKSSKREPSIESTGK